MGHADVSTSMNIYAGYAKQCRKVLQGLNNRIFYNL